MNTELRFHLRHLKLPNQKPRLRRAVQPRFPVQIVNGHPFRLRDGIDWLLVGVARAR